MVYVPSYMQHSCIYFEKNDPKAQACASEIFGIEQPWGVLEAMSQARYINLHDTFQAVRLTSH